MAVAGGLALAPVLGLVGVIAAPFRGVLAHLRRGGPALAVFLLWCAWSILCVVWSPAASAPAQAGRFAFGVVSGLALIAALSNSSDGGKRITRAMLASATIVLIATLLVEAALDMPISRFANPGSEEWVAARNPGRGATIALLLIWPAACALYAATRARWAPFLLIAAGAVLSAQYQMHANTLAFLIAAPIAALTLAAPRLALKALGLTLATAMLAAPLLWSAVAQFFTDAHLPFSWQARIDTWRSAAARLGEAPFLGHGFDSARTMTAPVEIGGENAAAIPLHPHSAGLQIWLETGAVGALLAAAALALAAFAVSRQFAERPAAAAALAGGVAFYAVQGHLSFGIWQEWWIAAALLFAAMIAVLPAAQKTPA